MVKKKQDYLLNTAKNKLGNWLIYASSIEELQYDIQDYRLGNLSYLDFKRKYHEKKSSKKSLESTIRRTYRELEKSNDIVIQLRGSQIRLAYEKKLDEDIIEGPDEPPEDNRWLNMIVRYYTPVFETEKVIGSIMEYGRIGYYKALNDEREFVDIHSFMRNIKLYCNDGLSLIIDLREYYNTPLFQNRLQTKSRYNPYVIKFRFCIYEYNENNELKDELWFDSGYLDIQNHLNILYDRFKNYYDSFKFELNKIKYKNSGISNYLVAYMCVETIMKDSNMFMLGQGTRLSNYIAYK